MASIYPTVSRLRERGDVKVEVMNAIPIQEDSYKKKIGKITFVVTAFSNSNGSETASQLLLKIMEDKVLNSSIKDSSKRNAD